MWRHRGDVGVSSSARSWAFSRVLGELFGITKPSTSRYSRLSVVRFDDYSVVLGHARRRVRGMQLHFRASRAKGKEPTAIPLSSFVPLFYVSCLFLPFLSCSSSANGNGKRRDLRASIHQHCDGFRGNRGNVKFRAVFVERRSRSPRNDPTDRDKR